jgi:hypothetical protein
MPTSTLPRASRPLPETGPNARPLGAYAALVGAFGLCHALAVLRRRPPPLGALDLTLLALASYQLGRTVASDQVTAPLRAPFVEARLVEGEDGTPAVRETPTGSGLRVALWGAGLQTWGWLVAPRLTRPLVWILAASGAAHLLQRGATPLSPPAPGGRGPE